ncbi:MAG: hypothetical protein P1U69_16095 [Parvibaculaceae bacterium]|nr:hypothetical protein [Parvibaculaceae bacterium]HBM87974.1 hypothetical protein [Rhodobiaceae bacterium]|tara:strand:- start:913 stop:1311 length:399 start_codon:yes stop_codon:yes gene_type:complete
MIARLLVTFGALVWGLGVPFLEINDTHVFNPDWTPHALIHEVWQLFTNTGLAGLVVWLVWVKDEVVLGAITGLFITGGFLSAFIIRDTYGGSMKYLDGSEKTVAGLNLGVLGFSIVAGGMIIAILLEKRRAA